MRLLDLDEVVERDEAAGESEQLSTASKSIQETGSDDADSSELLFVRVPPPVPSVLDAATLAVGSPSSGTDRVSDGDDVQPECAT